MSTDQIILIVPCYNERKRLAIAPFQEYSKKGIHFCFVDDGSKDGTADFLRENFKSNDNVTIFPLSKNVGKAEAIRQGMLHLAHAPQFIRYNWVGFWDADLATPLNEIDNMMTFKKLFCPTAKVIFASRVARLGADIKRSYHRHYLGRFFATFVDVILKVQPYDSQCGAKLFHATVLEKAFQESFISRWIFDVEILLRLQGIPIVEYPLQVWNDIPGSKVKISREIFRVFRDLLTIRKKYSR